MDHDQKPPVNPHGADAGSRHEVPGTSLSADGGTPPPAADFGIPTPTQPAATGQPIRQAPGNHDVSRTGTAAVPASAGQDAHRTEQFPHPFDTAKREGSASSHPALAPTQQFPAGGFQPGLTPPPPARQFGGPSRPQPAGLNVPGLISLGFGFLSFVLAFFLSFWSWIPGVVAVVCGILGLVLAKFRAKKLMAILGIVLALLAIPVATASALIEAQNGPREVDPAPSEQAGASEGAKPSTGSSSPDAEASPGYTGEPGEVPYTTPTVTDGTADIEVTFTTSDRLEVRMTGENKLEGADKFALSKQEKGMPSPWTYTESVKVNEDGYIDFNAEGWADNFAKVTCELKVDGQVVMRNTGTYTACYVLRVETKK